MMDKLPLELLLAVTKLLHKHYKKALRLVSKRLLVVVTPQVFDSVYLSHDPADLDKAKSVFMSHASLINTIVLHPMCHVGIRKGKYRVYVKREHGLPAGRAIYGWRFEEHLNIAWRTFLDQQRLMSPKNNMPMFESVFRAILQGSPNLRKLIITNRKRHAVPDIEKFCRLKDCLMPLESHAIFNPTPMQCSDNTTVYSQGPEFICLEKGPLPKILNTISASGSNLRELIVEHGTERAVDSLIRTAMQTFLSFTESCAIESLMSNLTKLRLILDNRQHSRQPHSHRRVEIAFNTRAVARKLASARNLERLSLSIVNCRIEDHYRKSPSMFHYILHDCRFPKLQVFILDGCAMEIEEIMDFLVASPRLRHLVLASCVLNGSYWASLVELIKAKTYLTALSLEHVRGHSRFGNEISARYFDYDDALEKFMFRGGPNPFVSRPKLQSNDQWVDYDKIWRSPNDHTISSAERKVDWYHEKYF